MAANLSNLFVPGVTEKYIQAEMTASNAFVKSGAAVVSGQLSTLLSGGAKSFTLPFWNPGSTTGIVPSTDYDTKASVQKMSAGSQIAVRMVRAITPKAMTDLEGLLIAEDPAAEAIRSLAEEHAGFRQTALINVLSSVTALDSADVGTDADLAYADVATSFSGVVLTKGIQSVWGDAVRGPRGMTLVMNSLEFLDLQVTQTAATGIQFPDSIDVGFGTYMGATIVIDDAVPNDTVYVIRKGGLAYGSASLVNAFAIQRDEFAGNGAGADVIFSRDLFSYHVAGTSYTGTIAGDVVTDTELGTSAKWSLAKNKKLIGVMKITHA